MLVSQIGDGSGCPLLPLLAIAMLFLLGPAKTNFLLYGTIGDTDPTVENGVPAVLPLPCLGIEDPGAVTSISGWTDWPFIRKGPERRPCGSPGEPNRNVLEVEGRWVEVVPDSRCPWEPPLRLSGLACRVTSSPQNP